MLMPLITRISHIIKTVFHILEYHSTASLMNQGTNTAFNMSTLMQYTFPLLNLLILTNSEIQSKKCCQEIMY